jgi:uncharacterized protein DUF4245
MSGQGGRYQRSTAGMVGAMIVLVLIVAAFVVFRDVNRRDVASPVREIDYAQDAAFARQQAGFDLVAPPELPEGWRATTARFVDGGDERWHLGMLTEDDRYVGLEQSGASVDSMVETHVDEQAERGKAVLVAGEPWRTWSDDGGDLALVRADRGTTTLVVGHDVPVDVLVAFAASLR